VCSCEQILEIGCGLALASLVSHRRGANVTASDCHPLAESFLKENLRLNKLPPLKYRYGQWGYPKRPPARDAALVSSTLQAQYDLIIGSDLLYERDASASLAAFIARHSALAGEVWIIDPGRGNRPAFNRQMADQGFLMREEQFNNSPSLGAP